MPPPSENQETEKQERPSGPKPPTIAPPKGGGGVHGIGEKFTANPVTGTGSMSVPIATSPGRSGFGPQLSLSYDSGSGNGPFGFGWNLSLPSITRKTDKGLPRYCDGDDESDVFILSGAEDLVPVLLNDGTRFKDMTTAPGFTIRRYRPRVEGLFARIERWTQDATGASHWRSISRDNVTTFYGKDLKSQVTDPADHARVFTWLICESYDDKGNALIYEYASENDAGVDKTQANEARRLRTAGRYLRRVKYGNKVSRLIEPDLAKAQWLFELVFDYDQGHYEELSLDPNLAEAQQHRLIRAASGVDSDSLAWAVRPDPFSSYRAGFERRTYRRCRRALMFHNFAELGGEPCLVRSTEFDYADLDYTQAPGVEAELAHHGSTRTASFIVAVTQSGFVQDLTKPATEWQGVKFPVYIEKSMPPLAFEYSRAVIQGDVRELDADSLENLPAGLDGRSFQWVDLDGEGVTGILTEQADAWYYKPNLGDGRFGPQTTVAAKPSSADLRGARQQLLDLDGGGRLDLADFRGPAAGFFERTQDGDWEPFRSFRLLPQISWDQPNLRFIDLDGDGHADVLITEQDVFTWHPSLAKDGFGPAQRVNQPLDEEEGPRLVLADGTQSIYLADMTGDGLTDLVRIRNGEVCYWPNLGYGRFGPKVAMDGAPWFDEPDQFDQRRIRVADLDGSGTNDIVYLGRDGARLYFNQSGSRWTGARRLKGFPKLDDVSSVMTADLLGNGTACLVWSSPLPGDARRPLRYVDLMGGQKPHLLVKSANNLGAEMIVTYAPSTKFYLADKKAGTPWITRISFPVHVVERVETCDRISGNRFVTRYAYHHGYFDGFEREFRGFGMVEQWDTEEFAALNVDGAFPTGTNVEESSHVPPILTKTWFHTGVYLGRDRVSNYFADSEYFREPRPDWKDLLLPDTLLPGGLTLDEEREACRALKGSMLRQEVYARDKTQKQDVPYSVVEQNFAIKVLQKQGGNRHGVFLAHPNEAITCHYERNAADPRVGHALTLEVDELGSVKKSAAVGYGRRAKDPDLEPQDQDKQKAVFVVYTENDFTNAVDASDDYRAKQTCESRTYELTGYPSSGKAGRFQPSDFVTPAGEALACVFDKDLSYEEAPIDGKRCRRLIGRSRTLYRPDDFGASKNDPLALLALGALEPLALPGESYKLAFTPGLLKSVYRRPRDGQPAEDLLPSVPAGAGYVDLDGDGRWWSPSGRAFFSEKSGDAPAQEAAAARRHFFLMRRYRDPFHTAGLPTETIAFFDSYDLLPQETCDALGNRVTVGERNENDPTQPVVKLGQDYRVLAPFLVMDPNRNRAEVAFDALGLVVGTAVMGKPEDKPAKGDSFEVFDADLFDGVVAGHLQAPLTAPHDILGTASTRLLYDLFAYFRTKNTAAPQPACVYTLVRETHEADLQGRKTKVQHAFSYSDGFGREVQKKIQAEAGPVPTREQNGRIRLKDGYPVMTAGDVSPRWVGSGWTVVNNKGKPVRKYEPFFSDTHGYEFEVRVGVSPILFYDPADRVVGTLNPNHTWEKVVFDPWRQATWDANDTVLLDPKADADLGAFFKRLPDADSLPTWHARRQNGGLGTQEQAAAAKAAVHAGTSTLAYADSLGRPFLTVAQNTYKRSDAKPSDKPIAEKPYKSRVVYDAQGNQREVWDALGRVVMRYDFDLLKQGIHQSSMEAGERWSLNDAAGKALLSWDSRGHQVSTSYDQLRRPTESLMSDGGSPLKVGRTVYGDLRPGAESSNLRGKVYQAYDQAGVVTTPAYDFKGNPLGGSRQLAKEYTKTLDWAQNVELETEKFISSTAYDALNRPVALIAPHSDRPGHKTNVILPSFNEANLLETVSVILQDAAQATPFVTNIDYDAKGQRSRIDYATQDGKGVTTTYAYDPDTLRLTALKTTRNAAAFDGTDLPGAVQNLGYVYDPVGNITYIRDDAQQTVFFRRKRVEPSCDYTYDSLYRLIDAAGREHLGQTNNQANAPTPPAPFDDFHAKLDHPGDGMAMGTYLEQYAYDAVGNILSMQHRGSDPVNPGWTRDYTYAEKSLLEPAKTSNRLTKTAIGQSADTYQYAGSAGKHGNITFMPHLPLMQWDFRDQLQATSRQSVNDGGTPETTWYVYDASGQRVRKVTDNAAAAGAKPARKNERIYLGGWEIYREYDGDVNAPKLERETLHVMDDQRRIALIETRILGDEPNIPSELIRFQLSNHLGSAALELGLNAEVISYEEFFPYGATSYQAVRSKTDTPKRYRFSAKERDDETGLSYHGARYYGSWIGRWTSGDPSGIKDGVNIYCYVHDRPITGVDPTGRDDQPWWRFTQAGTYYSPSKHDLFTQHPGYDTGWAPLNLVVNLVVSTSNLCTIPFNAATRLAAVPEELVLAAGGSQMDAEAVNLWLMTTGIGEIEALPGAARYLGALIESRRALSTSTELRQAAILAGDAKQLSTAATDAKLLSTAATDAKQAATAANETKQLATAAADLKQGVAFAREAEDAASIIERMGGKGLRVDVGGGGDVANAINLNPLKGSSGGPTAGVPNLIKDTFANIGKYFKKGTVKELFAEKLRFVDIEKDLAKAAKGAFKVMEPSGTVKMNIWTSGKSDVQALINAFKNAGFKDVHVGIEGLKDTYEGVGTMLFAKR